MFRNPRLPIVGALCIATIAHLLFAPVPIDPQSYAAPDDRGYTGPFGRNNRLSGVERIPLQYGEGPEDGALGPDGTLFFALRNGIIARLAPGAAKGEAPTVTRWANTEGCPLGIEFDGGGTLWVADAYRGLLSIEPEGAVRLRATKAAGVPIRYADDVAVTHDGVVYLTDASTKFSAKEYGGAFEASLLDTVEHGRHGRLLRFDPNTEEAVVVRDELAFPNGIAVAADGSALFLAEMGEHRILKLELTGPHAGTWSTPIDALPGFPDNIETGREGRLWVGLVVPRNKLLDFSADKPFLRLVSQRLPPFLRPQAPRYGHLIALSTEGRVLFDLQDPEGRYAHVTGAVETADSLYVTSLMEPELGRLPWPAR